ncbi:ABC-type uncharacterized transport system permease subunit [Paenibacillus sp. PvP094]
MKRTSWYHLYKILIRTSIRSRMQYKFNFILASVLAALIQISEFLMVALVLHQFGAIKGWSLHEIGYLFAIMTLSKTLYRTFGNEVHHLEKYLVGGELDQLLTRPMPVLLALLPQNFRIMVGEVLQGGFILCWSLAGMMHSGADRLDGHSPLSADYCDWSHHPLLHWTGYSDAGILDHTH